MLCRSSDGVFVLAKNDATLTSYRAGQHETRVGRRRTVERFERGDRRLRYDVTADGSFEPSDGRVGFPVVHAGRGGGGGVAVVVMVHVVMAVIGGGLFDGRQTGGPAGHRHRRRPFAVVVVVVVVGQRRGGVQLVFGAAAAVVPGHAGYRRVPLGGGGRGRGRARARLGGVHLVTRTVAADGQRLPVMLVVLVRRRVAQRRAAVAAVRGQRRRLFDGRRRRRRHDHLVADADFRRTYVGRRFAAGPVGRLAATAAAAGRDAGRRGRIAVDAVMHVAATGALAAGRRRGRLVRPGHELLLFGRGVRRIGAAVAGTGGRPVAAGGRDAGRRGRRRRVRRRFPVDGRVLHVVLQPAEVRGDREHGGRLGRQEGQAARDERPSVPVIVVGPQFAVETVVLVAVAVRRLVADHRRETVVEHRGEHE